MQLKPWINSFRKKMRFYDLFPRYQIRGLLVEQIKKIKLLLKKFE
jgi:hypothetical protein